MQQKFTINYELSKTNILKKVTQEQIAIDLFKLKIPQKSFKIKSLIREKDPNPSMQITIDNKGNFLWYDHGLGIGGDIFDLVEQYFEVADFREVLEFINKELKLGLQPVHYNTHEQIVEPTYTESILVTRRKLPKHIHIDLKPFSPQERNWWKDYGISIETLKHFNVSSCRRAYIGLRNKVSATIDYPVYSYKQKSNIGDYDVHRIYRPMEKHGAKFLGNATIHDVQGIEQMPEEGKLLVITKSLKDVMVLYEHGISAIAPHSETSGISTNIINPLFMSYNKVILFFDDDNAGREGARRMSDIANFNIPKIWIPQSLKVKDISDLRKEFGEKPTIAFINNTIKKYL